MIITKSDLAALEAIGIKVSKADIKLKGSTMFHVSGYLSLRTASEVSDMVPKQLQEHEIYPCPPQYMNNEEFKELL